jgi:hypothetical protein
LAAKKKWDKEKLRALHGLNGRLAGVTLMTYDQLLAQGERLVELIGSHVREEGGRGSLCGITNMG